MDLQGAGTDVASSTGFVVFNSVATKLAASRLSLTGKDGEMVRLSQLLSVGTTSVLDVAWEQSPPNSTTSLATSPTMVDSRRVPSPEKMCMKATAQVRCVAADGARQQTSLPCPGYLQYCVCVASDKIRKTPLGIELQLHLPESGDLAKRGCISCHHVLEHGVTLRDLLHTVSPTPTR